MANAKIFSLFFLLAIPASGNAHYLYIGKLKSLNMKHEQGDNFEDKFVSKKKR